MEGGPPPPGKIDKEELETLRCTCDANGKPGGFALCNSGGGCDPDFCASALAKIECIKGVSKPNKIALRHN